MYKEQIQNMTGVLEYIHCNLQNNTGTVCFNSFHNI